MSKYGNNINHATRRILICSYHVLTSSVRYQSTDARQNEIYLLTNLGRMSVINNYNIIIVTMKNNNYIAGNTHTHKS